MSYSETELRKQIEKLAAEMPASRDVLLPLLRQAFVSSKVREGVRKELVPMVLPMAERYPAEQFRRLVHKVLDLSWAQKNGLYNTLVYYQSTHESYDDLLVNIKAAFDEWLGEYSRRF